MYVCILHVCACAYACVFVPGVCVCGEVKCYDMRRYDTCMWCKVHACVHPCIYTCMWHMGVMCVDIWFPAATSRPRRLVQGVVGRAGSNSWKPRVPSFVRIESTPHTLPGLHQHLQCGNLRDTTASALLCQELWLFFLSADLGSSHVRSDSWACLSAVDASISLWICAHYTLFWHYTKARACNDANYICA